MVPLLLFVVAHGVLNAFGSTSESTFAAIGRFTHGSWWNVVVLCAFVWIPLVGTFVHAVRARRRVEAALRTPVATVSGIAAIVFLAWHLWGTSVQRALGRRTVTDLFHDLVASLSSTAWGMPLVALGALIGSAAVTAFLACAALDVWSDLAATRDGARRRTLSVVLVAVGVFLLFAGTVIEYATGAALP